MPYPLDPLEPPTAAQLRALWVIIGTTDTGMINSLMTHYGGKYEIVFDFWISSSHRAEQLIEMLVNR